ncbi:MAG: hypothetical protein ACJ8CB_34165 [Ktedonobacteraceae bacterium]|jgi:hypothetical protein
MIVALRKTFLLVVMALALLAGLFGWTMKMQPAVPLHHSSGMQSTHTLAMYCPPPPYDCR